MAHNCPVEWVYVIGLGCFQSWSQFYGLLLATAVIASVIGVGVFALSRYQRNREGET